jgi:hypothetical protein
VWRAMCGHCVDIEAEESLQMLVAPSGCARDGRGLRDSKQENSLLAGRGKGARTATPSCVGRTNHSFLGLLLSGRHCLSVSGRHAQQTNMTTFFATLRTVKSHNFTHSSDSGKKSSRVEGLAWAWQLPPPQPQGVFSVAAVCRETSLQHRGFIWEGGDDLPARMLTLFGGYVECFDVSVSMAPFVRPLPTHAQHHCTHTHTHTCNRRVAVTVFNRRTVSAYRNALDQHHRALPQCRARASHDHVSRAQTANTVNKYAEKIVEAHTESAPHSDA